MNSARARLIRRAIRDNTMELREDIKAEAIDILVNGYRTKWLVTLYALACVVAVFGVYVAVTLS